MRQARRCLNALCDTGASDDALAETRRLVAQLDATPPRPYAGRLAAALKAVLACQQGLGVPGLPPDLRDRAAAACDARGRRRPGEIVLSFAGDCTFGTVNGDDSPIRFPSVYRRAGREDYPFALVRPWFLNDDLTVVNFECTLTDAARTADKQWHFKGPARYAAIFPAGSVEAVGLANNHSGDYLQAGFHDTVANFRKAHVPVFYQNAPYVKTLQGVQTVLIGDCTVVGENTTQIDGAPARVLRQIRRYKKPDTIVIVVMHWGSELAPVPFPWQQALGRQFIAAGADAVVGAHPHVVQGIELYKGKVHRLQPRQLRLRRQLPRPLPGHLHSAPALPRPGAEEFIPPVPPSSRAGSRPAERGTRRASCGTTTSRGRSSARPPPGRSL